VCDCAVGVNVRRLSIRRVRTVHGGTVGLQLSRTMLVSNN